MTLNRSKLIKLLIAVFLGNILYFVLSPHLPPAAQHRSGKFDLGTVIDFWFCLLVYGLVELGIFLSRGGAGNRGRKND